MKKLLLIIGIVSFIICVLFLLFAVLNLLGYYNVLDGSADLYNRLHQRMIIFLVTGVVLAMIGTASIIIYSKI